MKGAVANIAIPSLEVFAPALSNGRAMVWSQGRRQQADPERERGAARRALASRALHNGFLVITLNATP